VKDTQDLCSYICCDEHHSIPEFLERLLKTKVHITGTHSFLKLLWKDKRVIPMICSYHNNSTTEVAKLPSKQATNPEAKYH
jgi:hypothetical protein